MAMRVRVCLSPKLEVLLNIKETKPEVLQTMLKAHTDT